MGKSKKSFFFGFDACFDGKYDIMQSNKGKRLLIRIPQEKNMREQSLDIEKSSSCISIEEHYDRKRVTSAGP